MLEKHVEKDICEYLEMKGFFVWKNPSVGLFDSKRGRFRKSFNKYQISGVSDLIAVKKGKVYFIEVKAPKGRQTENQKVFEENLTRNGGRYVLARSIDDVSDL